MKKVLGMTASTPLWNVMLETEFLNFSTENWSQRRLDGFQWVGRLSNGDRDVNENGKKK